MSKTVLTADGKERLHYEELPTCEYGVIQAYGSPPEGIDVFPCGEPATRKVWWGDASEPMTLCLEHFDKVCEQEASLTEAEEEL